MKINIIFLSLVVLLLSAGSVKAEIQKENKIFNITIDKATIDKGYTVTAIDDKIKLSLVPGILNEATPVEVIELNEPFSMPWAIDRVSAVYQFEFKNKSAYDNHTPFYIQLSYEEQTNCYKQVYFYDKGQLKWRPLPTRDFPDEKFVRSLIHLPYARIAVFSYPDKMTLGRASWYAYKPGDFTASPDFPKGSRLRVTNVANDKFVDVVVNDWGPDRGLHPERVVDLEKRAFVKLASLGAGMIDVKVEPLFIAEDSYGQVLGVSESGVNGEAEVKVESAVVIDETDGSVLFEKNATSVMPLASLTKIVAIKVYLETRPTLSDTVKYSVKDEEYNYEYAAKWEIARLKLDDGDEVTIEDLLYASLVGSANNTVETLVRASGLQRDSFIRKMNDTVKKWGASSTKFFEPTGLDPQNVSTARDYAIISREVLKHPIIAKATVMPEYRFTTINTKESHKVRNTNSIIRTNTFNITGSKTGYLHEAKYCLMTRVEDGAKKIIVVTLGADTRDQSFFDTTTLMRYGLRIKK